MPVRRRSRDMRNERRTNTEALEEITVKLIKEEQRSVLISSVLFDLIQFIKEIR